VSDPPKSVILSQTSPHRAPALLASCAFHALVIGVALLVLLPHRPPVASGSRESVPSLTLSRWVATPPVAPRPIVAFSKTVVPALPSPAATLAKTTPHEIPKGGVPVLARRAEAAQTIATPALTQDSRPELSHGAVRPTRPGAQLHPAARASSYAAGANVFPHPPYPEEARDLRQAGTVVVSVRFDERGRVAAVEVTRSSGYTTLDNPTQAFIRANWRSAPYAGRTVSEPVEYTLEN
jgi:protein TonB